MALLTRLEKYNIEDSNIALLGSDLEKEVREHAGDKEVAWQSAGLEPGTQVWRIEQFSVKDWPKSHYGHLYDGDSYIVLHTYKKDPDNEELSYDLHFWLGSETTQDEAGTAAYKTVELDDHLGGAPVQYREIQSFESPRFLSYFPKFVALHGGVASGFHHVTEPPPANTRRLFRISSTQLPGRPTPLLQIREVPVEGGASIVQGGVYVLDMGDRIWQFNTQTAAGKIKFKAAEFVQSLVNDRQSQCDTTVYDEHGQGAGIFLAELGLQDVSPTTAPSSSYEKALFRLSDSTGQVVFEPVAPPTASSLSSDDAFVLDDSANPDDPSLYVWIGRNASLTERRLALQYGQRYLYERRRGAGRAALATHIVKINEGRETDAFDAAIAPVAEEQ